MGILVVKGIAERTVDYDVMEIEITFRSEKKVGEQASQETLRNCEEFLDKLKKRGFDVSRIELVSDTVTENSRYIREEEQIRYVATRTLKLITKVDMTMLHIVREYLDGLQCNTGFNVDYQLSNEQAITDELLLEAIREAKKQADIMATAIGQKVVRLKKADKNTRNVNIPADYIVDCLCTTLECDDDTFEYPVSKELKPGHKLLREYIMTEWEIE